MALMLAKLMSSASLLIGAPPPHTEKKDFTEAAARKLAPARVDADLIRLARVFSATREPG